MGVILSTRLYHLLANCSFYSTGMKTWPEKDKQGIFNMIFVILLLNFCQWILFRIKETNKDFVISLLFPATGCPLSGWVTLPSFLLQHQLIRLSQQSGPFLPATILAVDIWNNPKSWPCSKPVRVSETCAVVKLLGTDTRESWLEADIRTGLTSCQPSENVAPLLSNCKGWGCQNSVPQENIKHNFFFRKHLITRFLVNGSLKSNV